MQVVKPPQALSEYINYKGKIIFLAGSIEMGSAPNWQQEVEQYLSMISDLVVLNPRRDDWDSSWEQKITNPKFNEQVTWELEGLRLADVIMMYFAPGTISPISLLEFGLWAKSGKLVVCCPEGFARKGNVDIVCKEYNIPQVSNLLEFASFGACHPINR